jgi:polysaccharide deacetylase family protein (PEP-CTERM system associated)
VGAEAAIEQRRRQEVSTLGEEDVEVRAPRPASAPQTPCPAGAHFFTVDVEEHFQVSAFEGVVSRDDWSRFESRVGRNVATLLDLLASHRATGTFFVLGWVAEHQPQVVRAIADAGHEIASHGQDHRRVTHQTPAEFRSSVRQAKAVLEDITGVEVGGFRAPSFSIVPGREWAFDVLLEEGYRYDSSLFPIRRPGGYGYAAARRTPHWIERPAGRILELPLTTLRRAGVNLPASGGAYFRIFPYGLTRAAIKQCAATGLPAMFYLHPWEVDPEQPRIRGSLTARVRHYTGLRRTVDRLTRLLREFRFTRIDDRLAEFPTPAGL